MNWRETWERPCTWAAIKDFPTDRANFLLVTWWHGAAVSYTFSDKKKNSLPGRVPSTRLAVFRSEVRNDNEPWVKEGTTESREQIQSLGTSSLASVPGIWNGHAHHHHHQGNGSSNERHSSRALEVWDVCWQAKRQRGVFYKRTWRRMWRELVSGMCQEGYFSHLQRL